ncbi:double-stranded RNA-binding protein 4-like [Arachis stenosperma]|uniref:double-stranded RNA-binding protein 4-like n=1 Tax=Arachis stenosperma TaxID=217475 RepID=UPI0025AC5704|nr:double-stranded RNA-binding protein 4-like [Arachis stenosperma]
MHKNKLQEYLQKSGFPLPVYLTDNEGFAHAPKFRSTVVVNGREFKSRLTYSHRKEAEQDAAELALKIIIHDTNNIEECTVLPDLIYCKSILNEYAVRKNIGSPQYTTTQKSELHPVFISTLVFNGRIYTGQVGKSKKEAEQLAAFITIQSLLGTSNMFLEGSSKQMTDTPGPIKRKLDSINLESKKQTREPGQFLS